MIHSNYENNRKIFCDLNGNESMIQSIYEWIYLCKFKLITEGPVH